MTSNQTSPPESNTERLLRVDEVAERLSVSAVTVRRLIRDCKLAHVRIGDRVLVSAAQIADFIQESSVPVLPGGAAR